MSSRSLRIAMVAACPFPARRGTPLRVERLAEALVNRGHELELVTYDIAEEIYAHAHPVHRPSGKPRLGTLPPGPTLAKLFRYDPALAALLRGLLRQRPFDVIHGHHYEGILTAVPAARSWGIPLVYDAHTTLSSELPSYRIGLPRVIKRGVGAWLDRHAPAMADHIVAVTPDIREKLINDFGRPPATITVAMNGVEAEQFARIGANAAVPDRVIYCGTMARYQGIDLLLRAFAIARQRRPSLELVFVVSASFQPYETLAGELGIRSAISVEADSLDLLPERLARAAIAVLPRSTCDGIPQKLLNYMAAGKGIVAFRGSAKILQHGETGLVVDDNDVEGFGHAIVRLAEEPGLARHLGAAARVHVLNHCTWDSAAQHCEGVYEALVTSRHAAVTRLPA